MPPPCHPGERILASGSVQLPRFTLLESGSLLVSPAHLADAGTYTCLATNSRGVDEASADLVVWGKAPVALRSAGRALLGWALARCWAAQGDAQTCCPMATCGTVPTVTPLVALSPR